MKLSNKMHGSPMKGDNKYENHNSWRDHMERHGYNHHIHHHKFMVVLEWDAEVFPVQ